MIKTMIISDIHGAVPPLEKILDIYRDNEYKQLIILGDILYHGPRNPLPEGYNPQRVIQLLNPLKKQIVAVRGNCDSEVDQMVLDFPMRGDYTVLLNEGKRIYLTHGHLIPQLDEILLAEDILIHGHTHVPKAEFNGRYTLLNPGSVALPKENYEASYGVLDNQCFTVYSLAGQVICDIKW